MKNKKHDHKATKLIQVLAFALILSLPILEIISKSLYTIFNPNAKDSYYGETINETIYSPINNQNNLSNGNTYYFYGDNSLQNNGTFNYLIDIDNFNLIYTTLSNTLFEKTIEQFRIAVYSDSQTTVWGTFYYDDESNTSFHIENNIISFEFTLIGKAGTYPFSVNSFFNVNHNKLSYLDNVWEYAKEQQTDNGILSWCKNSYTYTAINNMMEGLNIYDEYIACLLSYWIMFTAIYIVIDIILFTFTYLTHIFNN